MKITKAQRISILNIWQRVCKDRGWKTSDRTLRLATIGKILGRELPTLDDVGRLDECTRVMAELEAMLGVSLRAGLEAADPGRNRKRNWRWLIANEVLPCLALYVENGMAGAEAYLLEVMVSKTRWRKTDQPECDPTLADFDERTCQHIFWTMSARLNSHRKAAGDTGHDMKTRAGVNCDCARICQKRILASVPVIPGIPQADTDDAAESVEMLKDEGDENPY